MHEQLKAAGMRLERIDCNHYRINWRHQTVASGLTLLGAARFIDRALNRPYRAADRELDPLDVLADLLAEDPFDLVDTEGGARLIIERLTDAGFTIVPTTDARP